MTPLGVVLVGLGRIGYRGFDNPSVETHAKTIFTHPDLSFDCAVDIDEMARSNFEMDYTIGTSNVIPPTDILVVATPPATHLDIILNSKAKAILCEKPLADNVCNARIINKYCKDSGIVLLVGHQRRYDLRHQAVRGFILSGVLGAVESANSWFYVRNNDYLNNGTHAADTLRFLAGDKCIMTLIPDDRPRLTANVSMQYGTISIDSYGNLEPGYMHNMYDDLIHCLKSGSTPQCSGDDGVEAVRLASQLVGANDKWIVHSTAGIS